MIKPSAMSAGHAGEILSMIEKAGFGLIAMKLVSLKHATGWTFLCRTQCQRLL